MKKRILALTVFGIVSILASLPIINQTANAGSQPQVDSVVYLPVISKTYPLPVYLWLSQQQDNTTGLLPSQQDNNASLYNNALAVMAYTLKGDSIRAKRILGFFNNRAGEFFDERCDNFNAACSYSDPCGENAPCGFFEQRDSTDGIPFPNVNRWMGDNAWLLMAIHHYQDTTGDTSYTAMAEAIVRLLKSFQQPAGYIASGWEHDDQSFNNSGHAEGNLDAYKALILFGEAEAAQRVKHWLDFTDLDWKSGPLDHHSWRVQSLGSEYGFSLPDTERTDDETIRYKSTITHQNLITVTGHLHIPAFEYLNECKMSNNIWMEGTGQMAVSFYKAGYPEWGNFYVGELEKLLFEPAGFPRTQALPFLALADSECHEWVDLTKGHVAAVSWYIFAKEHFDPFDGEVMASSQIKNPIAKIEAENYAISSTVGVRWDNAGDVSEGNGIHVGGDDQVSDNDSGWVEYEFNVLVPVSITMVSMRYADDVGGDTGEIILDSNLITGFVTDDTGTWEDYLVTNFSIPAIQLQPGLHTLRVEVTDMGTWGFTVDYFHLDQGVLILLK